MKLFYTNADIKELEEVPEGGRKTLYIAITSDRGLYSNKEKQCLEISLL